MVDFGKDLKTPGSAIGIQAAVSNQTQGGTAASDKATSFDLTKGKLPVKTVHVWIARGAGDWADRDLVKAIKVVWTDGTSKTAGHETGNEYDFDFGDQEKVNVLKLWTGNRVDKVSFTTSNNRTFAKGGAYGEVHSQEVGNGVLLGFKGSANADELVSLGSKFDETY